MTDLILSEDFTSVWSLAQYLEAELSNSPSRPIQILHGWPEPDKKLKMPTIAVSMMGDAEIRSHDARFQRYSEIAGDGINVKAIYTVGAIEMQIVADIWESSKSGVGAAFSRFKNAINKAQRQNVDNSKGLTLELQGYYGTLARYDIVRYNYIEGEAESQRREHRIKVVLTCHFNEIMEVTMPKIADTILEHEISDNVDIGE